jgi:hypothetical protein
MLNSDVALREVQRIEQRDCVRGFGAKERVLRHAFSDRFDLGFIIVTEPKERRNSSLGPVS